MTDDKSQMTDQWLREVTLHREICHSPPNQPRGKGVGKALIKGVYDQAKNTGSARVYWHTHETNKTARRLYDQVAENPGFIVYRNHEWPQIQTPTANGHE